MERLEIIEDPASELRTSSSKSW